MVATWRSGRPPASRFTLRSASVTLSCSLTPCSAWLMVQFHVLPSVVHMCSPQGHHIILMGWAEFESVQGRCFP